jgi:hypothetical protein
VCTAWPVSLGFSGLFDDFAFFGVLAVDIAALLDGFRRRFCGLMTIDDQVAMDFQKLQKRVKTGHAVLQHDVVPRNTFQRVEDEPSTHSILPTGNPHQSNGSSGGNDQQSGPIGGNGFSKTSKTCDVWRLA